MYIKKVIKQNSPGGKKYQYLHLVENVRTERGPRQRLILNLGRLDIPEDCFKELANCIEAMITGQKRLFTGDPAIEAIAGKAVRAILKKNAEQGDSALSESESGNTAEAVDYIGANLETIAYGETRSLGPELVCHEMWNELKLNEALVDAGVSKTVVPIMEALVTGRMISPGSERQTHFWSENLSSIFELAGPAPKRSLNSLYRAGDKLFSLKETLEEHLSKREKDLFNLSENLLLMDLTNTYFEGEMLSNPKAQRGHSKEKRSDCKLLTLALIIDEAGFPKYSRLYPGNQSEFKTFREMITSLVTLRPELLEHRTVIMDKGIASKENIDFLKAEGFHYIVVSRRRDHYLPDDEMKVIKENEKTGARVEAKRYDVDDEVHLFCRSLRRVGKEEGIRSRQEKLFLERLEYFKHGLTRRNRTKTYSKILENIGRIREKYSRVAKLYDVDVIMSESRNARNENLAQDIIWKRIDEKYDNEISREGCYLLRTDLTDLSDAEIWKTYTMLTRIERSFRAMKSFLGARPNFHQLEDRADAHLFISVLAYHLLNAIEFRLRQFGDHREWCSIRKVLSNHTISTISFDILQNGIRKKLYLRIPATPEPGHREIYDKLGISMTRVKSQRRIY